jgi:cysteine desulfurase/selenocysteine lyase
MPVTSPHITPASTIDWEKVREDFPILRRVVNKHPLVYLDNAASSQKPQPVLDAILHYYTTFNANVHRGVHTLSQEGTNAFEESREVVRRFIHAAKKEEVIFTKGTTESINLVAYTFGRAFVHEGDEIIVSTLEHHSNIVPWQMLCDERKAKLKVVPLLETGELDMEAYHKLLGEKTKLVAVAYISNALGTINPVKEMIAAAHRYGAAVLVDGAQSAPHLEVNVQDIDCDFYAFSGHKICAPTGTGILYGKESWLEKMPPYQGGGEMIRQVTFEKTTYNDLPFKFEAGTPNIEGVIGLRAAIEYLQSIGMEKIAVREKELLKMATEQLQTIENFRAFGPLLNKASVLSFLVGSIHPYDMGVILDKLGIAVRTGHHCTQPLMNYYGIPGTVRASFAFYNNEDDVQRLVSGVKKAAEMLS